MLSVSGVKPNPAKTEIVEHFPVPRNPREVRSFLGLTNYYRRFVKGYSTIAAPLNKLLSKDVEFSGLRTVRKLSLCSSKNTFLHLYWDFQIWTSRLS